MAYTPDIEAYFRRIGHAGGRRATLETLDAIVLGHIENIPFENLDVLLGRGIDLDAAAVERKLVHERRGGYCFEQNSLLLHVLHALGYRVAPLSARVRIGQPRSFVTPRTHMFLRVDLEEGAYMVDVGVGALSVGCALRLDTQEEQATPHEPRRVVREGRWSGDDLRAADALLFHQVRLDGEWRDICDFTLEEMPAIDRELGSWFTSTHPSSHFRDKLIVAKATADGRVSLLNRTLKVRDASGRSEAREIDSPDALLEVLEAHFGLHFASGTRFLCAELRWDV